MEICELLLSVASRSFVLCASRDCPIFIFVFVQQDPPHPHPLPFWGSIMPQLCVSLVQAEVQPVEDTTSYRPPQDPQGEPSEPPAPPRPPPMTPQEIAAYRSGEDPDFDPVERRGWWEVNLAAGGPPPPPASPPCSFPCFLCVVVTRFMLSIVDWRQSL